MIDAPTGAHVLLTKLYKELYPCALGYKLLKKEKVSMMIFTRDTGTTRTTDTHYGTIC